VRFAFIATEKACYPRALMCRVLKFSRSGYYTWCQRPAAPRTLKDQILALEVTTITGPAAAAMAVREYTPSCASAASAPGASASHA
jgi:hypothetical protein